MGGKAKIEKTFLKVHCPCCGNGRLFDIGLEAKGTVRIKCPVCRNPVEIHFRFNWKTVMRVDRNV